jgi:hypothetical protein
MCSQNCMPIFYDLLAFTIPWPLGVSHNRTPASRAAPEREARTRGALHGEMQSWLEEAEALLEHSIAREVARSNGSSCRPRRRAVRRVHALRPTPTEAAFALRRAEELHGHSKSALSEAVRAGEAREASFRHELFLARGDTLDCRRLS